MNRPRALLVLLGSNIEPERYLPLAERELVLAHGGRTSSGPPFAAASTAPCHPAGHSSAPSPPLTGSSASDSPVSDSPARAAPEAACADPASQCSGPGAPIARSRLYIGPAVGAPGTPDFHNRALLLATSLPPREWREVHRTIERRLGRVRTDDPNAARTIDIDVLLALAGTPPAGSRAGAPARHLAGRGAAGEILADPPPDPDLLRWHHVALPAAELLGDLHLPDGGMTLAQRAATLGPWPAGFRAG